MSESEQRRIFSNNLNRLLSINNKTQKEVADAIKVSPQTFNTWCQGIALPRMAKIQMLADYFNVEKSELIEQKLFAKTEQLTSSVKIPVFDRVAAGAPINASDYIVDWEEIPASMAKSGEYFGVIIKGNSMEPRICEGDIAIVKCQSDVESGDIAIVLINGENGTCKKILKTDSGITLISFNPQYDPVSFSWKEVENLPVVIRGKVEKFIIKV